MVKKKMRFNEKMKKAFQRPFWPSMVVMAVCFLLLTFAMVLSTSPQRYNLAVGDIAPQTITATKDVIAEVTTELLRERAAENVQPSYKEDEAAAALVLEKLEKVFSDYEKIRAYGQSIRNATTVTETGEEISTYSGSFSQEELEYARQLSPDFSLSTQQLKSLMQQEESELNNLRINTINAVSKQLESTIREGQINAAVDAIRNTLEPNTPPGLLSNIAIPTVRAILVPNMVVDQEATEAAREQARMEVEPTYYKSGQNIVVAGERVTAAQLGVLESLGLLEGNRFDLLMMVGVVLLGIMSFLALLFYILQFDREPMSRLRNALLLATIFGLTMVLSIALAKINPNLVPVSMVVLLVTTLLSPSLAVITNALALILVSVLTNTANSNFAQQMLYILVSGVFSAPAGIYVLTKLRQQRASVFVAGLLMALLNFASMCAIGLLTNSEVRTVLDNAVWSAGGNVVAAIVCIGAQPILEWAFNLVTPSKLVELSNPNQPLLRRLLVEAPGTYHHSIMAANLAEAAAEAIGADALLTRVGAYYHDIGKLGRPLYFKENQLGDNPHDRTDPRVSAAIICEHVTDGMTLARHQRLPDAVCDFICQHHGDTMVSFFYEKMRGMEGGEDARIEDFRYPGPRPQTAETAILMLADTVEAAIRAGGDQPAEVIEKRIRELIKGKIDSGQLDDSPLRFADVKKIANAFTQVLIGIYHKRIEYPQLGAASAGLPPANQPAAPSATPYAQAGSEEK